MRRQAGFTIVETLFVLAIAGLIMLIVFEAVPALTRSSRNNQRKQDVTTILRAVSQYELRDGGNFPLACDGTPNACTNSAGGTSNDYFLASVKNNLTFYVNSTHSSTDQVILTPLNNPPVNLAPTYPNPVTAVDKVYIYNYQKCNGATATPQGAGYSNVVALYALENGTATGDSQCQQL